VCIEQIPISIDEIWSDISLTNTSESRNRLNYQIYVNKETVTHVTDIKDWRLGRTMKIQEFEQIVKTDRAATRYLTDLCSRTDRNMCLKCGCEKLYAIEKGRRRRCSNCGYTFHQFTGRWLDRCKISAREWLWIIKLFELETPAKVIADETGISYPTVLKAVTILRMAIAEHLDGKTCGKVKTDGTDDCDIYGLMENGGDDRRELLPETQIILLTEISDDYLILIEGSVRYDALLVNGRKVRMADKGGNYLNYMAYCSIQGFWQYAKEKLIKYHGVSCFRLPLYLKEVEFRWLNRDGEYFESVAERLCEYVPGPLIHAPELSEILQ
jgi:transposase